MIENFDEIKQKLAQALIDEESDEEKLNELLKEIESVGKLDVDFKTAKPIDYPKLTLKVENRSTNPNPEYQKEGDSGFDLRANLTEPVTLRPMERQLIPTGLYFEIPEGFEIQVRPRSGLALKNGITIVNTPGTVDEKYRGEVCIILINLGYIDFTVNHGDRIAQAVLAPVVSKKLVNIVQIDKISTDTDRGSGGFGSTGV